jgi:hypothetical protein
MSNLKKYLKLIYNNYKNHFNLLKNFLNRKKFLYRAIIYNVLINFFDILFFLIPLKIILFYSDLKEVNHKIIFFLLITLIIILFLRIYYHYKLRYLIKLNTTSDIEIINYLKYRNLPLKIKYYNREYLNNINFVTKFLINIIFIILSLIIGLYYGIIILLIIIFSLLLNLFLYFIVLQQSTNSSFIELKKIIEMISFLVITAISFILLLLVNIDVRLIVITMFISRIIIQNNFYLFTFSVIKNDK